MTRMVALLLAAVAVVAAEELVAVVRLVPHDPAVKDVKGELTLTQSDNGPVKISGKITGLTEGNHGFHVHEKGDLREGCASAGAHFNPENVTHGGPSDTVRHVGDLGNVKADANGDAEVDISDTTISLKGTNSIIGRAIVVHSDEDDLGAGNHTLSLTTGNAGERWACGIVGVLSPTGSWNSSGSFAAPGIHILLLPTLLCLVLRELKI